MLAVITLDDARDFIRVTSGDHDHRIHRVRHERFGRKYRDMRRWCIPPLLKRRGINDVFDLPRYMGEGDDRKRLMSRPPDRDSPGTKSGNITAKLTLQALLRETKTRDVRSFHFSDNGGNDIAMPNHVAREHFKAVLFQNQRKRLFREIE